MDSPDDEALPTAGVAFLDEVLKAARSGPIDTLDRVHPHQPPVPVELMWFVRHGLEKDPAKRRQSIREMIDLLDRRAEGEICVECPVTLAKATTLKGARFIDKHPAIFMAAATSFMLFFVALVVFAIRGIA